MFSGIKKHFYHHFIPHKGNDHRPHILRDSSIRNILAVVIFLEIFTFVLPTLTQLNTTGGMAAVLPAVLANLTNNEREDQDLPTLTVNSVLNEAAEMKARDMAANGYFAHTSPEGKTPWYWLELVGYNYQYAGENLAINFSDSKDVTQAWMESPTHRANIVKGNYTEIGTGVARGIYEGEETIFVAQLYANPIPIVAVSEVENNFTEEIATPVTPARPVKVTPTPTPTPKPITPTTPKTPSIEKIPQPIQVAQAPESSNILGVETVVKSTIEPAIWQKLLASPRSTMNAVLLVIFGIMASSLILYILIKIRNHHMGLITNGMVVLSVLGALFLLNYYTTHRNMVITTSLDYASESL